jgi:tetratricopeptide (TPR) repeat protein
MGSQSSASTSGGHASETVLPFAPTASLRKGEPQSSEVGLDQRISELSRAIQLNPRDAKAYRSRGLLQGRKEAYDAAISDLNNALSLNPDDATSHAFRAIIWQRKNNSKRAIADFDRAIKLDPANAGLYRAYREKTLGEADPAQSRSRINTKPRANNRFNLFQNPFVLLGVAPNATAQDIKEAYTDAPENGLASADDLQQAQQVLLTPHLRIDAEVGGFLGVAPDLAKYIIGALKKGATKHELADALTSLPALPRSNVMAHLGSASPMGDADLLQLLQTQATIVGRGVYDAISEVRWEAGTGEIDRDAVADALARLEKRQTNAVIDPFVDDSAFAANFAVVVKRVLGNKDPSLVTKLDRYIRAYDQATSAELSQRREMVIEACDAVRIWFLLNTKH